MTTTMNEEYFSWLCNIVYQDEHTIIRYDKLLNYLHDVIFTWMMDSDDNRAADGCDLRIRFGRENGYADIEIDEELGVGDASILEVLVALALRCEQDIMSESSKGDRTSLWFWSMINSLGLSKMYDKNFDRHFVDDIIVCFFNRTYESNGMGGLFTLKNPPCDMTEVNIWMQMNYWLIEKFKDE